MGEKDVFREISPKDQKITNMQNENEGPFDVERKLVRKLSDEGYTLKEIAEKLGKRQERVSGLLNDPAAEEENWFRDHKVVPYLIKQGHEIIKIDEQYKYAEFIQEIDIVSVKDERLFITEVKGSVWCHRLQTAIGQMVIHKLYETGEDVYQIAFPEGYKEYVKKGRDCRYFSPKLLNYLDRELGIKILFI